nr:MAG TPA: hypothetical protein [Bacteriophage sp.]
MNLNYLQYPQNYMLHRLLHLLHQHYSLNYLS